MGGSGHWRPIDLLPEQNDFVCPNIPFNFEVTGVIGKAPVFRSVCGQLMQCEADVLDGCGLKKQRGTAYSGPAAGTEYFQLGSYQLIQPSALPVLSYEDVLRSS